MPHEPRVDELVKLIENEDFDKAKILLDSGVNINKRNHIGIAPLYQAARKSLNAVKFVYENGAQYDESFIYNIPLHAAVMSGNIDVVKYFIDVKNVNYNIKDDRGYNVLHIASQFGNITLVKYFLNLDININSGTKKDKTPLYLATIGNHINVVRYLIHRGANINYDTIKGRQPIHVAAGYGNIKMIKLLISNGADMFNRYTHYKQTPLSIALKNRRYHAAKLLMSYGIIVNIPQPLLHFAAHMSSVDFIKAIYEKGKYNVNSKYILGRTPLHYAARHGCIDVIKFLLDKGAGINVMDDSKETPIFGAIKHKEYETVKYLVERGAKIDVRNDRNRTPLHEASWNNHYEITEYLISQGADVNARDNEQNTPLHVAIHIWSKYEYVKLLLDNGADINAKDRSGWTALSDAKACCNNKCPEIVELLISRGGKE